MIFFFPVKSRTTAGVVANATAVALQSSYLLDCNFLFTNTLRFFRYFEKRSWWLFALLANYTYGTFYHRDLCEDQSGHPCKNTDLEDYVRYVLHGWLQYTRRRYTIIIRFCAVRRCWTNCWTSSWVHDRRYG